MRKLTITLLIFLTLITFNLAFAKKVEIKDAIQILQYLAKIQPEKIETGSIFSETDSTEIIPYKSIINSADWGANLATPDPENTDVSPMDGNYVLSINFEDIGKGWGLIAIEFESKDISKYATLVFSLDTSSLANFNDLEIKIEDGAGNGNSRQLSPYVPKISGNWSTYAIPLNDFSGADLSKMKRLIFANPIDANGNLLFGKLYLDKIFLSTEAEEKDEKPFIVISSNPDIQSDVVITDTTVGEWSTGTQINPEGQYAGKNCWELTSSTKTPEEGNWGTVLAIQDGINGNFNDYSGLKISIATTGGYSEYKVTIVPTSGGNNIDYILPVNDAITSWQDISIKISDLDTIAQIAIIGEGGNSGASKIYVTDFKLEKSSDGPAIQKFVIISSDANTQSDVAFSDNTIGEWSTGTISNGDAVYEGKKCWELKSGQKTPEQGNWGTVLVFQDGINGDFSLYSNIKLKIATGDYNAYKLSIAACGVGKEIVLPVNKAITSWQSIKVDITDIPLNLKSIDSIAVLGAGGTPGTSKFYVTDFEIVKDKDIILAPIDDDFIFKSSDPSIHSNLIVDGDNNSDQGNVIFGEWGTQTKLEDANYKGLDCWKLTAVAGWGAVLALQGDISDGTNIDNYDVDLSKYTNIKFKIASEGSFERYALSIGSSVNGNSVSQEVGFSLKDQTSWNEIDIDLDNYGVDLSNVSQMALFGVYPGGAAAGQTIYITDFIIYDTGIVGNNEKDSSDDKFVFKSSTDEQVDIVVDGDDCAHNGNITINDWSTNTVLQDTEYKGSNCWELKKGNGWGAVLALMGDMYGDVMTYDIDLTKYSTLNIKMAAEGAFTKYLIKFIGGAEFAKEFSLTADWKDFSINLNEIPLNLLKLQQIVIYGEGGNAGDNLYITDLNISK